MREIAVIVIVFCLFSAGCATSEFERADAVAAVALEPAVAEPIHQIYPVVSGMDAKVTFENLRACDAVQLGLFLLSRGEGDDTSVICYDDVDFFPRYFSMINTDISDGLLFISEREARSFARAAYLKYQGAVTDPEYLKEMREHRILEDFITPEQGNSVQN